MAEIIKIHENLSAYWNPINAYLGRIVIKPQQA